MVDAPGPQPNLRGGEAAPLLAQNIGHRDPDLVEANFGVAVLVVLAEHGIVADDGDAGSVLGHQHHRLLPVHRGGRVGLAFRGQHPLLHERVHAGLQFAGALGWRR